MTLVICWVLFPLLLGALCLGCGLLIEVLAGDRLPSALVLPAGLALIAVVMVAAVSIGPTVSLATPAVVTLAVAGLGLGRPWERWPLWRPGRRAGLWAAGAAVAVFAVYAAPVVLSGQATFTGYVKLDDSATFMALIDRALDHGRSLAGLAHSSYERTLWFNLATGYPLGSMLPLGVGGRLMGQNIAWLYQPYMAFMGGMLALVIYELARPVGALRPWRALIGFLAAQAALLYAYVLWGGIKESAGAWMVPLVAALIPFTLATQSSVRAQLRRLVPIAVATAAVLDTLSVGGGAWLAAPLLLALVLLAVRRTSASRDAAWVLRRVALEAGAFAALAVVLALPAVTTASPFVPGGSPVFTSGSEWGNLLVGHPVNVLQVFGVWPTGDFRVDPSDLTATRVLIAVTGLAGLVGLWFSVARRNWGLLAYLAAAGFGIIVFQAFGSPWVAGKGLAGASPALVAAGMVGAAAIWSTGRRAEATAVAGAIAAGILWSNFLGYQDANLAPRARLAELDSIDHRFAGQGPTLMTEYEPFGVRHFLHDMDPEGASELRYRPIPLTDGTLLPKGASADLDRFALSGLLVYRTLVIRRSPAESRPPSVYHLAWQGRYYDVWQRPVSGGAPIISHLGLGEGEQSGAVPSCADVVRLARAPGVVRLAAPPTSINASFDPSQSAHPDSWNNLTYGFFPFGPGTAQGRISLSGGDYSVFIRGAFRPQLTVRIDGHVVASLRHELTHANDDYPLAQLHLAPGAHQIALTLGGATLHPGSGGATIHTPDGYHPDAFPLGPLIVGTGGDDRPIVYVAPSAARSLCGRQLDWVEALGA